MNLTKINEYQKKLDNKLQTTHKYNEWEVFKKKKIALIVELSELLNETKIFKYWSKKKETNRENILFEYADCMHFILSISNYFKLDITKIKINVNSLVSVDIFDFVLKTIKKCSNIWSKNSCKKALIIFLQLGHFLDLKEEEIEEFYFKKNQINFSRIENNY